MAACERLPTAARQGAPWRPGLPLYGGSLQADLAARARQGEDGVDKVSLKCGAVPASWTAQAVNRGRPSGCGRKTPRGRAGFTQ